MAIYDFLCLRLMEGLKSENRENTWKFTKEKSVFPPIFNPFYLEAWKLFILSQTYNQTRKYINFGSNFFLKVFRGAKMLQNCIFDHFWPFWLPETLLQKIFTSNWYIFCFGRKFGLKRVIVKLLDKKV